MSLGDVQALSDRLTGVLNMAKGRGITNAEAMGVLEIVKLDLYQEILNQGTDNDVQPE